MTRFGVAASLAAVCATGLDTTGGRARERSLMEAWSADLDGHQAEAVATPVARVVSLLKEMGATLQKDADDDQDLYQKLACWCNNGQHSTGEAIDASQAKTSELQSTIEALTAKSSELKTTIEQLEEEVAANRKALGEATALREKEQQKFHGGELDSIQAIENLKAALEVLSKHHGANAATPWGQGQASSSLLQVKSKDDPFSASLNEQSMSRSLDDFMAQNSMGAADATDTTPSPSKGKFLQQGDADAAGAAAGTSTAEWSTEDSALVMKALKTASAFAQAKHGDAYMPSYSAQSGEIMGVLKQLKEEMEDELSDEQKSEMASAKAFADLRAAKTAEIESGEKMSEKKEDEKAQTDNDLAEAKEDLGRETDALDEAQKFLLNMKTTCADADKNYEARKAARLDEQQAITETIRILTEDEAKDAMKGTYGFVQLASARQMGSARREVVAALRRVAGRAHSPQLSMLASRAELDSFTKVRQAIADMISMLKTQQEQEVKKNDWCQAELQENEMGTARTQTRKTDLDTSIADVVEHISAVESGIADANKQIQELTVEMQRASEDRVTGNRQYQKSVADQTVTIEVLKKALDRLATFYDTALLIQSGRQAHGAAQAPPVPQAEYKRSAGAQGVMQMIEKLIHEAKNLVADSKKGEAEAQASYEMLVADTNAETAALHREVVFKTKAKAMATKDKLRAEADVADAMNELEGLAKYNGDLHQDCDYLTKNFDARQNSRSDEIQALQQATQILSGASMA